jgi:arylsulfatase A-like enzyme
MDELASRGVLFSQARAQGPMTRFSVPSLMSGRYFSELERTQGNWPRIYESNLMMAEVFRQGGYHTAAFHTIGYLVPIFGLNQGFDTYDVSVVRDRSPVHWNPTSDLLTERILAYFDSRISALPPGSPWLVWAYYGDPHSGYIRHEGMPVFGPKIQDVYDQEIFFTDLHLGKMLDGLRERGHLRDTVVILTSDHGEGLNEDDDHGFRYHGQTLYDNLLRVPLILVSPGVEPGVVDVPVGNIDVMPTLLELTRQEMPAGAVLRGRSLMPLVLGQTATHPPVFSEKVTTNVIPQKSMVEWPYKIIWRLGTNRWELFNLVEDPQELRSLRKEEPETFARMKDRIQRWRSLELTERKAHLPSKAP